MSKIKCYCYCDSDECARFHNSPRPPCNCIRQISKSTKFIERILDCSQTIVRVLSICGIHECKAKAAVDVIVFAFLHYDIVPDRCCDVLRKKLRKEDVFHDLGRKCRMNRIEAHLAYSIIKKAFKAFYYKQTADMYNPDLIDESQWMHAAERSAEVFAISEGLSDSERKKVENRIKCSYCSYIQRVQDARKKESEKDCACCFCRNCQNFGGRSYRVYANVLPREDDETYRFKKRLIEEGKLYASAYPDPCGKELLDRQNRLKNMEAGAEGPQLCTCGAEPCVCKRRQICDCGKEPCICKVSVTTDVGITVEWTAVDENQSECLDKE